MCSYKRTLLSPEETAVAANMCGKVVANLMDLTQKEMNQVNNELFLYSFISMNMLSIETENKAKLIF